jgi:predicted AlkP superfamily pyrophosphatase or phosphodiesterase
MKPVYIFCLSFLIFSISQAQAPAKNVFIITLDGVRWQEIFKGADSALLRNEAAVQDTTLMLQQYWDVNPKERRRRLLPFFWSVLAKQGQLMGNRDFKNKVNVDNLYKISYPGYNEIFTGYPDKIFIPNLPFRNPNNNVLAFLNNQNEFAGRVAAFCSWRMFPFILNEKHNNLPVNAGYEALTENDSANVIINNIQKNIAHVSSTRHDLLTYEAAKNHIEIHHPKVLYLGLGETDEFAHHGSYDLYLQKLRQADAMIAELWYMVQTDPFYKNNTSFIITTDHGRGRREDNWNTHGFWVSGSGETWLALLGNGIEPVGELYEKQQVYQKQIAATIAILLGLQYEANHPVAKPLTLLPAKKINSTTEAVLTVKAK